MISDSPWGRLEPGHYTRNLHGFVLSVYRGDPGWEATLDGKDVGAAQKTLRAAKVLVEAEAGRRLDQSGM